MITTRKVYCGTANESLAQALSLRSHFKKSVLKFVFQLHHERVIFAAIILMWLFYSVNRAALACPSLWICAILKGGGVCEWYKMKFFSNLST